ncbi:MAG: Na+/H+ antiporter, partial [Chloroflexota bacterium]|nr:Na+/H+ antiporter [Chloroflexota bacterium]
MHTTPEVVEFVLGLLVVVAVLVRIADRLRISYPILLVLGGLTLSLVPNLPELELAPDLVFLIFLPPLLMYAAYFTSIRDFRANLRPIGLLAVGLVLTTTVVVAVVAHTTIGLPWPVAFVLGAIVSPPDAVAATAIGRRLKLPRRIVTVMEGESLVNDATALVALRIARTAAVSGAALSLPEAVREFAVASAGGVAIGLVLGWITVRLWRMVDDTSISVMLSFLATYGAYLLAEDRFHVSGVLAVVALGLYMGRNGDSYASARTRLEGVAIWSMVVFVLNGLVFILIGLQLRGILHRMATAGHSIPSLLWYAAAISLTVIVVRIVWIYPATYLPRWLSARLQARDPAPPWQYPTVLSWTGMRGVVSLAAALALPVVTASGSPFPHRDLLIFLTFAVILATLVIQGLTLAPVVRALGVTADGGAQEEEAKARLKASHAALVRLEQLAVEDWAPTEIVEHLRSHYAERMHDLTADSDDEEHGNHALWAEASQRLQREVLDA